MPVPVSASSLLRAVGVLVAMLLPWRRKSRIGARVTILASTDAAARAVDPRGITMVSVTPDEGETFGPVKGVLVGLLPTATWSVASLLVVSGVERLPGPRLVKAVALGAGIYALDSVAARFTDQLLAKAEQLTADADGG